MSTICDQPVQSKKKKKPRRTDFTSTPVYILRLPGYESSCNWQIVLSRLDLCFWFVIFVVAIVSCSCSYASLRLGPGNISLRQALHRVWNGVARSLGALCGLPILLADSMLGQIALLCMVWLVQNAIRYQVDLDEPVPKLQSCYRVPRWCPSVALPRRL